MRREGRRSEEGGRLVSEEGGRVEGVRREGGE